MHRCCAFGAGGKLCQILQNKILLEKREEQTYKCLGMATIPAAFGSDPDIDFTTDPWSLQSAEVEEVFPPHWM